LFAGTKAVIAVAAVLLLSWRCAAATLLLASTALISTRTGYRTASSAEHLYTLQAGLMCRKMREASATKMLALNLVLVQPLFWLNNLGMIPLLPFYLES